MAYKRSRRYYYNSGASQAERHIREAAEFSELVGGADEEVKSFFFSLPPSKREEVLRAYGRKYGTHPEEYARETFEKWRSGSVRMSGLVARRLFSLLPPIMSPGQKYEIAKHIWEKSAPSSSLQLAIGPQTPTSAIIDYMSKHLASVMTEHMIPERIASGFKWLSDDDVVFYEKLLNHFREEEAGEVLEQAKEILSTLQHFATDRNNDTKAESSFTIHKHTIYIKVILSLGDKIRPYTPQLEHGDNKEMYVFLAILFVVILIAMLDK